MSSPASNIHIGSVMGTGADITMHTLPFRPKAVRLFNSDGDEGWWQKDMADDSMFLRIDSTGVGSVVATDGITPLADGMVIGANANLNQAGKRIYFTAWCE